MAHDSEKKQRLHLVFGGELATLTGVQFRDLENLDIVGIFPDYESAHVAWKAKAQMTVDMRICATSSSTCIACSIRKRSNAVGVGRGGGQAFMSSLRARLAFPAIAGSERPSIPSSGPILRSARRRARRTRHAGANAMAMPVRRVPRALSSGFTPPVSERRMQSLR